MRAGKRKRADVKLGLAILIRIGYPIKKPRKRSAKTDRKGQDEDVPTWVGAFFFYRMGFVRRPFPRSAAICKRRKRIWKKF